MNRTSPTDPYRVTPSSMPNLATQLIVKHRLVRAGVLWNEGFDSKSIAIEIGVQECDVYPFMGRIKALAADLRKGAA